MSEWIVCDAKRAETPYLLDTIGKNIYTVDELCFYFWRYAHMLGEAAADQTLIQWIRSELRLGGLADRLEQLLAGHAGKEEVIQAVFQSVDYLSKEEWKEYAQSLKRLQKLTPFERDKRRADDLVHSGQYCRAIYEYSRLLKAQEAGQEETACAIYHNMGVANGKMLQFRRGAECFLKAFLLQPNKESLRQYKLAVRLCEEEIEEDALVQEFPGAASIDVQIHQDIQEVLQRRQGKLEEIDELTELKDEGRIAEYYRRIEEILQEWREECRGYMNNR